MHVNKPLCKRDLRFRKAPRELRNAGLHRSDLVFNGAGLIVVVLGFLLVMVVSGFVLVMTSPLSLSELPFRSLNVLDERFELIQDLCLVG